MPTRLLMDAGHAITVLYANSNIAPGAEYERRLQELQKYAALQGFPVIEAPYDPAVWEREVAPIGESLKAYSPAFGKAFSIESNRENPSGANSPCADSEASASAPATVSELLDDERREQRCRLCYRLRLEEAAAIAAQNGYDGLSTTLAVSPYQFTDVIRQELERACGRAGVQPHFEDYRPYYDEATRISRELHMYRQNYCGCRFSIREGEATRAFIKQQRKLQKAQREAMRAAEDKAAEQRKAQKRAYAEAQAKKRAILKELRAKSGM